MKYFTLIIFVLSSPLLFSQSPEIIISYNKGACKGNCPVYNITVNSEGLLRYHGIMNVEKIGVFTTKISDKELEKLICKLEKADLGKLERSYGMEIMDAPLTTVAFKDTISQNIVMSKIELPKNLKKAEVYLQSLTQDSKAKKIRWTDENKQPENQGRKELAEKMIIVQLNPNIEVETWIKKYAEYGLRTNKKISPNQDLYLLQYDYRTIQLPQILRIISKDKDVASVEENKKVEMR